MLFRANSPYLIRAFNQMAPVEEPDKDSLANWKYDSYSLRQGSGYIASSFWLGVNGTEMFKASMRWERCFSLVTSAMTRNENPEVAHWFPDAISMASHMIPNYQKEMPEPSDVDYQSRHRIRLFQEDIKAFYNKILLESFIRGKS